MLQLPAAMPVTRPAPLTVATAGLLLLQAPVPPLSTTPFAVNTDVPPIHKGLVLVMEAIVAFGFIVTGRWAETVPPQPEVIVNIILQVPGDMPVTSPAALTVATAGLLLLHVPVPPLRTAPFAVYVAVAPMHRGEVPVTDTMLAFGFIVTAC